MNPQLILAAIIAALGFVSAWTIQGWRFDSKEKERVEQALLASQEAAKIALRRTDNVIVAQNNAASRLAGIRRDAAASRAALDGVSHAAGEALRRALANHDSCLATATAASELLTSVSKERRELAEAADGHVNDLKTLIQAWPK